MRGYKRIRIFPDRDLRATRLEIAVIDCSVVQRLRNIRQLGQSLVVFPTAEHSRFSHALGALYWSAKMSSYLHENYFSIGDSGNVAILGKANDTLKRTVLSGFRSEKHFGYEISWFEQLIRLAALLHDVSHLPFGHTLEDQAGLLLRHDEDVARIDAIYARLVDELTTSPHLQGDDGEELRNILVRLLEQCKSLHLVKRRLKPRKLKLADKNEDSQLNEEFIPYLTLVHDIVNNTICADLIDYLQRDTHACGMPWTLDKALLSYLKILNRPEAPDLYRLGVSIGRNGKLRHDVITAVLGLLRTRYDITEKVYYHPAKCAADAMLEKAIRSNSTPLTWEEILEDDLGDEGLLLHLKRKFEGSEAASQVLADLRSRRFYKAIFRIRGSRHSWGTRTSGAVDRCLTPEGRSEVEREIAGRCKLAPGTIIISCLPRNVQLKEAEALVEWVDGDVLQLSDLPERKHYLPEVKNLRDRYLDLWALTVYIDPSYESHVGAVVSKCERFFEQKNDSIIAEYVRGRYPYAFELQERLEDFGAEVEVDTIQNLNVAYGGGDPREEVSIEEVMLDQIINRASERKGASSLHTKTREGQTKRKRRRKDLPQPETLTLLEESDAAKDKT